MLSVLTALRKLQSHEGSAQGQAGMSQVCWRLWAVNTGKSTCWLPETPSLAHPTCKPSPLLGSPLNMGLFIKA